MSRPVLASLALAILLAANVQGSSDALSSAAASGNIAMARQLIEEGVDLNQVSADSDWRTPLMYAVWAQNLEMVNLLIAAGAHVNYQNNEGETALFWAVAYGKAKSIDIVLALIRAGADLNAKYPDSQWEQRGWTPLMVAIAAGKRKFCEILIRAGSDLSYRNREGQNALLVTTTQGNDKAYLTEIVRELIFAGADVNVAADGWTPLMHAIRAKRKEMSKILIAAGADRCKIGLLKARNEYWKNIQREMMEFLTKLEQEENIGGIKCCPQFTTGDNGGEGGEHFVQEEDYNKEKGCKGTCLDLYPDARGITESLTQKYANKHNKCWCEMGDPILQENAGYQTCIFKS